MNKMHEIGKRIRTQDGACTRDPMFVVQRKVRDYGYDTDYCESCVWLDTSNDYVEATPEEAAKLDDDCNALGSGWEWAGYNDRWEFITVFFTRASAEAFIERHGHRWRGEVRIFVESFHRNEEMIAVRNHLVATSNRQDEHEAALDLHAARAIAMPDRS